MKATPFPVPTTSSELARLSKLAEGGQPIPLRDGTIVVGAPAMVRAIAMDPATFSNRVEVGMREFLLIADPPAHSAYRAAFGNAFGPGFVRAKARLADRRWEGSLARESSLSLSFNEVARNACASSLADILGAPREITGELARLGELIDGGHQMERDDVCAISSQAESMKTYADSLDAGPESADHADALLHALIVAGVSTWPAALVAVARHAHEVGSPKELLARHSPLHGLYRRVAKKKIMEGERFEEGTTLLLNWRAASVEHPSLAFGVGPHRCPARALVERSAEVLMGSLRDRSFRAIPTDSPPPLRVPHFEPQPPCRLGAEKD